MAAETARHFVRALDGPGELPFLAPGHEKEVRGGGVDEEGRWE